MWRIGRGARPLQRHLHAGEVTAIRFACHLDLIAILSAIVMDRRAVERDVEGELVPVDLSVRDFQGIALRALHGPGQRRAVLLERKGELKRSVWSFSRSIPGSCQVGGHRGGGRERNRQRGADAKKLLHGSPRACFRAHPSYTRDCVPGNLGDRTEIETLDRDSFASYARVATPSGAGANFCSASALARASLGAMSSRNSSAGIGSPYKKPCPWIV